VVEATYRAAVTSWPLARITLRQGARVVHENQSKTPPRLSLSGAVMLGGGRRH
jgi:hypothetical protein